MTNLLFILEGETVERNFLKFVLDKSIDLGEYNYYTFNTTIYTLYEQMTFDNSERDIIGTLKKNELREDRINELEKLKGIVFTDIYLIFDFDPHVPQYSKEKIIKMDEFFNNATENGKLYINYPMIESFKHIKSKEDYEFLDRSFSFEVLQNEDGEAYKKLVKSESGFINPAWYNDEAFKFIISMHLTKAQKLVSNKLEEISRNEYNKLTSRAILEKQLEILEKHDIIQVLNTSLFIIIDYNKTEFFANNYVNIKEHFEKLELNN